MNSECMEVSWLLCMDHKVYVLNSIAILGLNFQSWNPSCDPVSGLGLQIGRYFGIPSRPNSCIGSM